MTTYARTVPSRVQGVPIRPPADLILSRTLAQLADPNPEVHGQIVLLHDAGGDRSETVAALPRLIDAVRSQGYELVPVSTLAGLTQDEAMPPVPPNQLNALADKPVFMTLSWTGHILYGLFLTAVWLGIGRVVFLCGLAAVNRWQGRRRLPPELPADPALISILIPAYNEAPVLASSIERLLGSDYRQLMYWVVLRSLAAAVRGLVVGWGKQDRKATVTTSVSP